MNGKQLKNSILQWAIQGHLVPQVASEGSAAELLARIQAEKQQLVAEGKLKPKDLTASTITRTDDNHYLETITTGTGKKASSVTADITEQIPFDIPASWQWVRLGYIFTHNTGKALNQSNKSGKAFPYITTSNLYWDKFELNDLKSMPFTEAEIDKCTVTKGDLLVCEGGEIGRAAIWDYDYDMKIQNHIHRLRAYYPLCTRYFYYLFFLYKNSGLIGGKGIAIQGLSSGALHSILLPLPPLAEQQRIVQQIETLFAKL